MIIDARCRPPVPYFLGQVMYGNAERTKGNLAARGYTPPKVVTSRSMDDFAAEIEEADIGMFVVPGRVPNELFGGSAHPEELYRQLSDEPRALILEAISETDPTPEDAIARALGRGARGLVFEPGLGDRYLDDEANDSFYVAAQQAHLPVYIMGGGNAGRDVSYANPVALDRVAARFPAVTLVAVHAGWPWVQQVLGVAFRRTNVWVLPDLYFPGMPGEADYLVAAASYLQDRFLFASAYPFCNLAELVGRYRSLGLPDHVLTKVLSGNARRLFGIED